MAVALRYPDTMTGDIHLDGTESRLRTTQMVALGTYFQRVAQACEGVPPALSRDRVEALFLAELARFVIGQYNITIRHLLRPADDGVAWSIDGNLSVIPAYVRKPFAFLGSPILRQTMVRRHEAAIFWTGAPEAHERPLLCPRTLAFEDFFADHQYFIGASLTLPDLIEPSPWRITMGLRAMPGVSRMAWEQGFRANEWYIYELAQHFCHFLLAQPGYIAGMHYRNAGERRAAAEGRGRLLALLGRRSDAPAQPASNVRFLGWTAPPSPVTSPVPTGAAAILADLRDSLHRHLPDHPGGPALLEWVGRFLAGEGVVPGMSTPLELPVRAPLLYADRPDRAQDIAGFLRAVWMPWIKAGCLTRPALRRLDPQAYMAVANWMRHREWPSDLPIPSKSDMVTADLSDPERLRQARRLVQAHHARSRQA